MQKDFFHISHMIAEKMSLIIFVFMLMFTTTRFLHVRAVCITVSTISIETAMINVRVMH